MAQDLSPPVLSLGRVLEIFRHEWNGRLQAVLKNAQQPAQKYPLTRISSIANQEG